MSKTTSQAPKKLTGILYFPYHDKGRNRLELSKIDIFFYSYFFRAAYTIFIAVYLFNNPLPLYQKLPLLFSIAGCLYQGLGGACTVAIVVWVVYNLSVAILL